MSGAVHAQVLAGLFWVISQAGAPVALVFRRHTLNLSLEGRSPWRLPVTVGDQPPGNERRRYPSLSLMTASAVLAFITRPKPDTYELRRGAAMRWRRRQVTAPSD
jgi:hypothetical protein